MIHKLIIATSNINKVKEIKSILNLDLPMIPMTDFRHYPMITEDGATFEENAYKKARNIALFFRKWTLADDSGLEVDCLNGLPGVYSARFAGDRCSYNDNNQKLLKVLRHKHNRKAKFKTVIAISNPCGNVTLYSGEIIGDIYNKIRGSYGFGYDSIFYLSKYKKTFAELNNEQKNQISHRAKALKKARIFIENNII
jgi:XTP/dITP diphosphohydrolase